PPPLHTRPVFHSPHPATPELYTLSLHDALPISLSGARRGRLRGGPRRRGLRLVRLGARTRGRRFHRRPVGPGLDDRLARGSGAVRLHGAEGRAGVLPVVLGQARPEPRHARERADRRALSPPVVRTPPVSRAPPARSVRPVRALSRARRDGGT